MALLCNLQSPPVFPSFFLLLVMSSSAEAQSQARRIYISITHQCPSPREVAWAALVDKIRHPEKYVGSRDVKWRDVKTASGSDAVDREMVVGPPEHASTMVERITWDESAGLVTFTIREEDAEKSGAVTNQLHIVEGVQVLTFTFNLKFKPEVPQAKIDGTRAMLQNAGPMAVLKTIEAIKQAEEAGGK